MSIEARLIHLAATVDYLLAKRHSFFVPPRIVIVHGYHQPWTLCVPGEIIERCHLSFPDLEIPISLSPPGLMVCDCMVRHRHTPLSVARMERILKADPFYRHLGANAFERAEETPTFTRAALRVYIARLREQIAKALKRGGSLLAIEDAFVSEPTDSNVVVHRIVLPVGIDHLNMRPMMSRRETSIDGLRTP